MKKLLILLLFIIPTFILTPSIQAQSGFRSSWFYAERYQISYQPTDGVTYSEIDIFGTFRLYEIWRKAVWYNRNGHHTFYTWVYINGRYQWTSQYSHGTYWSFRWKKFKRYFYIKTDLRYIINYE